MKSLLRYLPHYNAFTISHSYHALPRAIFSRNLYDAITPNIFFTLSPLHYLIHLYLILTRMYVATVLTTSLIISLSCNLILTPSFYHSQYHFHIIYLMLPLSLYLFHLSYIPIYLTRSFSFSLHSITFTFFLAHYLSHFTQAISQSISNNLNEL